MVETQWYVYILKSESLDRRYTGITTDPERRLFEHNNTKKGARYTKTGRPWVIAYLEKAESRSTALKREAKIKKMSKVGKQTLILSKLV